MENGINHRTDSGKNYQLAAESMEISTFVKFQFLGSCKLNFNEHITSNYG